MLISTRVALLLLLICRMTQHTAANERVPPTQGGACAAPQGNVTMQGNAATLQRATTMLPSRPHPLGTPCPKSRVDTANGWGQEVACEEDGLV